LTGAAPSGGAPTERPAGQRERDQHKVLVGAAYNFLGALGRVLIPLYYVVANQVYGPAVYGLYALAISPTEILTSFVGSGFADAIQRFAARDPDRHEPTDLHYAVLWRCVWWVVAASTVAALAVVLGGRVLAVRLWDRPEAYPVLVMFAVNAPLVGVMGILLAACRALLDMKGDTLVRGFVNPLLLIALSVALRPLFGASVYGLGAALTLSNLAGALAAIWYFRRHYSLRRLWAARRTPAPPGLIAFAVPQSLNMAVWQGLWNLDVMMLGVWITDAPRLGLYRIAAEIGRTVYGVRFAFSSVYAPLVARYTLEGDHAGLQDSYTRLSRWVSLVAVPVVALVVLGQDELLWLVNPSYAGGASFLWLLLVGPLFVCATGLSGNILVMTGHQLWNLANGLLLVVVLGFLNWLLIPRHGLVGASVATMVAITGLGLLQIGEVWLIHGIRVEVGKLWKPFAAGALGLAAAWGVGAALVALGAAGAVHAGRTLAEAAVFVAVYSGAVLALRLEPDDAELWRTWRAGRLRAVRR
jgi:O-antigen/teichoic acid export membrane protein